MADIGRAVVMDWQLSSYFGWGVYGLNLMLNWSRGNAQPMLTSLPWNEFNIALNPLEWAVLRPALNGSRDLQARLAPLRDRTVRLDAPVLHALGNDFVAASPVKLAGAPSLGMTFFESTDVSDAARERAKAYPLIVAGSSWNARVLAAAGIEAAVELVLQGVDATLFHPAPNAGWFAGRFAVFSGGKLEYRKGQDLVLKAFAIFARRHPEAVLVTAWASPWPAVASTFALDAAVPPIPFLADGRIDATAWAGAYGIAPSQLIDLGALPNAALPRIYREMDVGVFPNRCEGGTNLVAMECMACGIPAIVSANTGHLDLIAPERCFALASQSPIAGAGRQGWGESDVEEIVESLETVFRDRCGARERGARGAEFMSALSWGETARRLAGVIAPFV